jgi:hypothetical protein
MLNEAGQLEKDESEIKHNYPLALPRVNFGKEGGTFFYFEFGERSRSD